MPEGIGYGTVGGNEKNRDGVSQLGCGGRLAGKFILTYGLTLILAATMMHVSNRYMNRYPAGLLEYEAKALAVIFGSWILASQGYTLYRLQPYLHMPCNKEGRYSHQTSLWVLLTRFPAELFWLTLIFGFVATEGFKYAELLYMRRNGLETTAEWPWIWLVRGLTLNVSEALLIAAIFYGVSRLLLRPHILNVQRIDASRVTFHSFSRQLIVSFVSVLATVIIRILWYVIDSRLQQQPVRLAVPMAISAIGLLGGLLLLFTVIVSYRREARNMTGRIHRMIKEGKSGTPRMVSVMTNDEIGELAAALNDLQNRLGRDYTELEEELQIARKVKEKLLPEPLCLCGPFEISFVGRTGEEPGGGFYDIVDANDGETAVLAGKVSENGAAAVLIISAILALFRSETRRGGTPASILGRLNQALTESFPTLTVTVVMVLIDRMDSTAAVAMTGDVVADGFPGCCVKPLIKAGPLVGAGRGAQVHEARWEPQPGEAMLIGAAQGTVPGDARSEEEVSIKITRK